MAVIREVVEYDDSVQAALHLAGMTSLGRGIATIDSEFFIDGILDFGGDRHLSGIYTDGAGYNVSGVVDGDIVYYPYGYYSASSGYRNIGIFTDDAWNDSGFIGVAGNQLPLVTLNDIISSADGNWALPIDVVYNESDPAASAYGAAGALNGNVSSFLVLEGGGEFGTIPLSDVEVASGGTLDIAAEQAGAAAAQLVTDKAAVTAGVADIKTTRTILTITGTYNVAAANATAAATQLATDQAGAPINARTPATSIGGVAGTLDVFIAGDPMATERFPTSGTTTLTMSGDAGAEFSIAPNKLADSLVVTLTPTIAVTVKIYGLPTDNATRELILDAASATGVRSYQLDLERSGRNYTSFVVVVAPAVHATTGTATIQAAC